MENVIAMLEEIMDLDEGTLEADMNLDELEEWDSLTRLSLMSESQKGYDKKLSAEVIKSFVTVQDICNFLLA